MKNLLNKSGRIAVIAAVALMSTGAISTAHADDHRRGHAYHARGWHGHRGYDDPGVVYAPPAVVEAPPPQPLGINLIVPLHIR